MSAWNWLVYLIPLLLVWTWQVARRRNVASKGRDAHIQAQRTGLNEPVSLHPTINAALCVGCSECVKACPEREFNVLGMVDGKAELINAGDCIGHGAISLVFGTAKRGIDIPILTPEFETNVPGIFVAGELGGMGLIRNALVQGTEAVEVIARRRQRRQGMIDVLIVGAGPAGFAASLTAMSLGLKYVTIEQESLGGCVFQYPRAKLVMTSPVEVPIIGRLKITQTSKEELLEFWRNVEKKTGVAIKYRERVESITPRGGGFLVRTAKGQYAASSVAGELRASSAYLARSCRRSSIGWSIRSSIPASASWSLVGATVLSRLRAALQSRPTRRWHCRTAVRRSFARKHGTASAWNRPARAGGCTSC
jgi:thioredoxin reductase (NADPH)